MAEEVKITVKQVSEGTALKDAAAEAEKLKQAQAGAPGSAPAPTPAAPAGPAASEAEPRLSAAQRRLAKQQAQAAIDAANRPAPVIRDTSLPVQRPDAPKQFSPLTAGGEAGGGAGWRARAAAERAKAETFIAQEAKKAEADPTEKVDAEKKVTDEKLRQATVDKTASQQKKDTVERKRDEQEITREKTKQAAEHKLMATSMRRSIGRGVHVAAANAGGLGPLGEIGSAAATGASAGPVGAAIAALTAAIAAVGGMLVGQKIEQADAIAASHGTEVFEMHRRATIKGHVGGEAQQEATAQMEGNRAALEEAVAKRGSFHDSGFIDMFKSGMNGLFGTKLETSGAKAARENELEIERRRREVPKDEKLAREKFMEGPGGMEMQRQKAILDGKRVEAYELERNIKAQQEYDKVLAATRDTTLAAAAGETSREMERRKQVQQVSHLINVRSGAAQVAQAARIASGEIGGNRHDFYGGLRGAIDALHGTVQAQHREAMTAPPTRTRFGRS